MASIYPTFSLETIEIAFLWHNSFLARRRFHHSEAFGRDEFIITLYIILAGDTEVVAVLLARKVCRMWINPHLPLLHRLLLNLALMLCQSVLISLQLLLQIDQVFLRARFIPIMDRKNRVWLLCCCDKRRFR